MATTAIGTVQTPRFQEKREAILSAAALRFNENGLRGATLSGIAGSVGLVTNSVTYYYRRKEDLAKACLLRSIAAFDELAEASAESHDVPDRLRSFFRGQARLLSDIEAGRRAPLILFNDMRSMPEPQSAEVFPAYTAMFRRVRSLLQGQQTRQLSRPDLNARAHIVVSIANWLSPAVADYETGEYERLADRVSDILIHGIANKGTPWAVPAPEAAWRPAPGTEGTTEAFLRAATTLVNEQGYRGASIDKISARLNVTKGAFYHHNETKFDLISECFERTFAVMREALIHAESSAGSGWQRACGAASAMVRFQLSADGPLLRASATAALPEKDQRERVQATLRQITERMNWVLVDGMADGSVRPLDPAIASRMAIASINAAAELHRWVPGMLPADADSLYVRPVLDGLLCPGSGPG